MHTAEQTASTKRLRVDPVGASQPEWTAPANAAGDADNREIAVALIARLIGDLNAAQVEYCHWKSNCRVDAVFTGETDIDLLVGQGSIADFQRIIHNLEFKAAELPDSDESHSVEHFYAFDDTAGLLVHLHVYYRVVTGGSILKNYHLPVERMLLGNSGQVRGLKMPDRAAELGLFVIRKMIEHGTPVELFMVRREMDEVREEIEWLLGDQPEKTAGDAGAVIHHWLPSIPPELIEQSLAALRQPTSMPRMVLLARRVRRALAAYRLVGWPVSEMQLAYRFVMKVYHRFFARKRTHTFRAGGLVIAVTGPEATGKSTVVGELNSWLGEHFTLHNLHAGKPPCTPLTWLPHRLLPLCRRVLKSYRTTDIEADLQARSDTDSPGAKAPRRLKLLFFSLRSWMLARDRRAALNDAFRRASRGAVVIVDRYPSPERGAMDSAQLDPDEDYVQASPLGRRIARLENRIYQTIPQPDVAIQLTVPVDVAVARDKARSSTKKGCEGEEYVRRRHRQAARQAYPRSHAVPIDTSRPLAETLLEIKQAIWSRI